VILASRGPECGNVLKEVKLSLFVKGDGEGTSEGSDDNEEYEEAGDKAVPKDEVTLTGLEGVPGSILVDEETEDEFPLLA